MAKVHELNTGVVRTKATSPLIVEICRYAGISDRSTQRSNDMNRANFVIEILKNPKVPRSIQIDYKHQSQAKILEADFWSSSKDGVLTFHLEYEPGRLTVKAHFGMWRRIYGTDRGLGLTETFDIDWQEKVSFSHEEKSIEITSQAAPQVMKWKPISSMAEAEHRRLQQSRLSQFRSGSEVADGFEVNIESQFLASSNRVFMVPTRLMSAGNWSIHTDWEVGNRSDSRAIGVPGGSTETSPGHLNKRNPNSKADNLKIPKSLDKSSPNRQGAKIQAAHLGLLQERFPKRAEELRQHALSGEMMSGKIQDVADKVNNLAVYFLAYQEADNRSDEDYYLHRMNDTVKIHSYFESEAGMTDFEIMLGLMCAVDKTGSVLVLSGIIDEAFGILVAHRDRH